MTLAEHFEEQFGAGLGERHIAQFVDDEQLRSPDNVLAAVGSGQTQSSRRRRKGDITQDHAERPKPNTSDRATVRVGRVMLFLVVAGLDVMFAG